MKQPAYAHLASRSDGLETRAHIIECAGRLIAERGFAQTTSKSICQAAQVNMAAVNYHFGSREGLYIAVLQEVHDHLMSLEELDALLGSPQSSEEKITAFLRLYIVNVLQQTNWYVEVWTRELLTPSPQFMEIFNSNLPKFTIVVQLFAQYLELPRSDMRLYACIFGTMAPFMLIYLQHRSPIMQHLPDYFDRDDFLGKLESYVLENLARYKKALPKNELKMN
ncbi:MAG: TetR/AcrR family transcriptional regulator [Phascolarctobacterium sp.]|uniref:TetR/AcrR family transcriptional regulator n=1 Tax=Phascolarctobacterium sp. TaxID=2049039 RepID=UPI0026DB8B87|nr:TetR/AcrR family transcriptional regulator [Phascolarctobacterium sp.]MDO4920277.1 TetR/AcrR family transcriptional regulator [Phascolarctobacterium sp.]